MFNFRFVFKERVKEVKTYVSFLNSIEKIGAKISYENKDKAIQKIIRNDAKHILKANIYLLSYNIVEATVRNVFEEIYENLKINEVSFDELRDEFKIEILKNAQKNLKNITPKNINEKIIDVSKDIIHSTFDAKNIFNGNIDAKLIKSKIEKIGLLLIKTQYSGQDLLIIKEQRNSLAHGDISFCECGRDLSMNEIISMLIKTKNYMETFLECAEEYIDKQLYKKDISIKHGYAS